MATLLQPPTPIVRAKEGSENAGLREEDANVNWPQLVVSKSVFEGSLSETPDVGTSFADAVDDMSEAVGNAWGDDDLNLGDDIPGEGLFRCRPLESILLQACTASHT